MNAQAAYTPPVDQPPPLLSATPYGGFWVRLAAHFVDCFIVGFLSLVLTIVWIIAVGVDPALESQTSLMIVLIVLSQAYHAYFVSSAKMATPGKRLCGLYVTDTDGHRLSFIHALGRNVASLLSYLTLYIGFFMAGFTARKQALHDKIAGTLVHRQSGGSAVGVIVVIVLLFVSVPVIGIVAAVALPAYQDYTVRAKMAGVIAAVSATGAPIALYEKEKGEWPTAWEQLKSVGGANPMDGMPQQSLSLVKEIRLEQGGAVVTSVEILGTRGKVSMTPKKAGDQIEWTCTATDLIWKYVPATCRK
jgi:uncharacterized RDD family membrane protein YckC